MTNKNELRIGNYVSYSYKGNLCIMEIIEIGEIYCKCKYGKIKFLACSYDELIPVPIDETWLTNFGYSLITENNYAVLGHLIWKLEDRFYCNKNGIHIKYIHQLQNLYFALTGKELILNE